MKSQFTREKLILSSWCESIVHSTEVYLIVSPWHKVNFKRVKLRIYVEKAKCFLIWLKRLGREFHLIAKLYFFLTVFINIVHVYLGQYVSRLICLQTRIVLSIYCEVASIIVKCVMS